MALVGMAALVQACTDRTIVSVEIQTVTVQPGAATLVEGQALQFRAVVQDMSGRALPRAVVTWSSTDSTVLAVDVDGNVDALSEGTVEVRATFRDVTGSATVTVNPAPAIELRQDSVVLADGDTIDFYAGAGAQSPAERVLQVRNGGGSNLGGLTTSVSFPSGQPDSWLTSGLAETEAPTTLTVTPMTAPLPVGVYEAAVSVSSPDDADSPFTLAVRLTLTDFTLTESAGSTTVTEAGSTDDFTVVLEAQPDSVVVLSVTTSDSTEVVASPRTLSFDASDWDQPQTVTVTGQDEVVADGDRAIDVVVAVVDSLSDPAFGPIPDKVVAATVEDDEVAGFTTTASGGSTEVSEAGGTDDVSVVLDAQPLDTVVVTVTASDTTEVSASPTTLTFAPAVWNVAQTITVSGEDDVIVDGDVTTLLVVAIDSASSAAAFDPLPPDTLPVITRDDDSPGVSVVESNGSTQVNEAGTADTLAVQLTAAPQSDVVLTLVSADSGEVTVAPGTLTFTPTDWDSVRTVVATGIDDALIDGDQSVDLTIAVNDALSDDAFDTIPDLTVTAVVIDDDTPGFSLTESGSGTSVTEAGSTDDFTIVLSASPRQGTVVVLDVASARPGEATVSPATVTFNPTNWLTPQTVTITGVDEQVDDGDQLTAITVSVDAALSDTDYASVGADSVVVTTVDDDVAAFMVQETGGGTLVDESGTTDDFTVVLGTRPVSDVVFTVSSLDPSEATVSPTTLTFTPSNWNNAQTVTVTGVDDLNDDGDQFTLVVIAVVDPASDDAYDPLADQSVNVTTSDNDSAAGLTITEISGTSVDEGGPVSDDFTVNLDTEPASDVVIDITPADATEISVDRTSLTFTSTNWDVPQTVNVFGVDDDLIDGDVVSTIGVAVDNAQSDPAFAGLVGSVTATTVDDDVAGLTVVEIGGTSVNEGGSTDDFTVRLDAEPVADVWVRITSQRPTEVAVSPDSVLFDGTNWSTPRTVTVTGVDDAADDGDQLTTIDIAVIDVLSDPDFRGLAEAVLATNADDDGVGLTITELGSTTVDESGSTDTFTVVLDAQPATDVVLLLSSGDTLEATVSPAQLTFTNADWATPQIVTVTGVDDDVDDGDQVAVISVVVDDPNSDPAYAGMGITGLVNATNADDDTAAFVLAGTAGLSVTEAGSTDAFTVVLDAQPTSPVVLDVTSGDIVEVTVASAQLTFTPANWNVAQTVTLTGSDDPIDDGDQVTAITVRVNVGGSDNTFDPLPPQTASVTTVDDDTAGLTLAGQTGLVVDESGTTASFTVVLDAQPLVNVLLDVTSSDTTEVSVSPATVTFTPANWATPRTVTVRGVDDPALDGLRSSTITLAVNDPASDNAFDGLVAAFSADNTDDDVAALTVQEFGGTRVSETGSQDNFTVVLDAQPGASQNVVFDVVSAVTTEVSVSPSQLIFTAGDWNVPQSVTVTGVDDAIDDGDQITTVSITADNVLTTDNAFDNLTATVSVTTTDDDGVGFTIAEIGSTTVPESGLFSDNFTVVLDAQPTATVVIDVTSTDLGEVVVSPATLTFGPGNYGDPQTVTVTGVDDDLIDGDQATAIDVDVDDFATTDNTFDGLTGGLIATTTDDDVAGFTLTGTSGLTVSEDGTTETFQVVLDAEPTSGVTLVVSSLAPLEATATPASIVFDGTNWDVPRTVTVTGVNDDFVDGAQPAEIRVQVAGGSDPAFTGIAPQGFLVTNADNDVAGLTLASTNGSTEVDESATQDTITVVLDARPSVNVVVNVASSAPTEATVSPTALTFTPSNWSTPRAITVTGADDDIDDGDQLAVVTVTVDNANSDDAFDNLSADANVLVIDDDDAGFTLAGTSGLQVAESGAPASAVFTAVLDTEPVSNVVLSVTSGDPGEVGVATSSRTFTPSNWATPQTITVVGVDDPVDDGNQVTAVTIAVVDASSDDAFDNVANQQVSVTTLDNDVAGFALQDTAGTVVSETGSSADFTVVLTTQPTSNVVLSITPSDNSEASVSPTTLTFVPGSWDLGQTVTVTGVDDDIIDGSVVSSIQVEVVDAQSDPNFAGLSEQTSVTTTDDDVADLDVVELGGTRVSESGSTDDFTVQLTAQPASNVVVDVVSTNTLEATVDSATLTFIPAEWDTPKVVQVTGVDDAVDDGDQVTPVTITVRNGSSDTAFADLADTVQVTTTDDDGVGFDITEFGGTQVSESGTDDQFGVQLTSQPMSDVVLSVVSDDPGEATVSTDSLTFTSGNWDQPQQVVVVGVDDDILDGAQTTPIVVSIDPARSDDAFDLLAPDTVQVTTLDDDVPGVTLVQTGGTTVAAENGATDTVTVVLDAGPLSNVTIDVVSADADEVTASPTSVVFTPGNWQTPQVVELTATDDPFVDGTRSTQIDFVIDQANTDPAYDTLSTQSVSAQTNDDDVPGLTVTESSGSTVATEGGSTDSFTVVLDRGPVTDVEIDVVSADPTEASVDIGALTFTPANWATPQTVTVTAENDAFVDGADTTVVSITVDAGNSNAAFVGLSDQVDAVTNDNDVPAFTLSPQGGTTVTEAGGTIQLSVALGSARPVDPIEIDLASDDATEATVSPLFVTFDSTDWQTPKLVTVNGIDDGVLVDGDQSFPIIASIDQAASDDRWDAVAPDSVTVTNTDLDVPGITLAEFGGTTVVDETGTTDSISVALSAQPLSDVVLVVQSDSTGEVTAAPTPLTFTTSNWSQPQIVTVTGVDDGLLVDGDQTSSIIVSVDVGSSDAEWSAVAPDSVSVTTQDNDTAGYGVTETGGLFVGEGGTSEMFEVVLTAEPVGVVVFRITVVDATEASVSADSLVFDGTNWNIAQAVTVTGLNDDVADGAQVTSVTVSVDDALSDDAWDPEGDSSVPVTVGDNDVIFFSPATAEVDEDGPTSDTFTVVLGDQPSGTVTLNVTSLDTGEVVVTSGAVLTFDAGNWSTPQVVVVTGVVDGVTDGNQITDVTIAVDPALTVSGWDTAVTVMIPVTTYDDSQDD